MDFQKTKQDVLTQLRNVARIADDAGSQSLGKSLRKDRIPSLAAERFHLVVLGEFNHGKTSFVNAMLRRPLLPTGVTPTTAAIHHLRFGDEVKAELVSEAGDPEEVSVDALSQFMVGGEGVKEGVRYLDLQVPSALLKTGVVLVDTPGVNDLNQQRAEITYGYVPRADAVIFLLDAGQILKESERAFLKGKLMHAAKDRLLFVMNKMDLLDEDERAEALAYAHKHLSEFVPNPRLFAVSAQKALAGDVDASGMVPFEEALMTYLEQERGRVLLSAALEQGLRSASVVRTSIEVQRRALEMDAGELKSRLELLEADLAGTGPELKVRKEQVRDEVAGLKATLRRDVLAFADAFAEALPAQIAGSKAEDLSRYLPGYIEERFRGLVDEQAERVAAELESIAERAVAFVTEQARARAGRLEDALGPAARGINLKVDTFAYDVGVFAVGAFGVTLMALSNVLLGGALALCAPVLAYVLRGRIDQNVQARAAEEAPRAVRAAAEKLVEEFERQVDEFAERLNRFLSEATEEMTRSIAEAVQAVQRAHGDGEMKLMELQGQTGPTLAALHEAQEAMAAMHRALWANGTGGAAQSGVEVSHAP